MSDDSRIRKRSLVIDGHPTSISLENAFWKAFVRLARERGRSVNALASELDRRREGNLSSAIRLFVLEEAGKGTRGA